MNRAPVALTPDQLAKAGRVWSVANDYQRRALATLGFGYQDKFRYQDFDWPAIGSENQQDIARGLARLCELIRLASYESKGKGDATGAGDRGHGVRAEAASEASTEPV